MLNKNNNMYKIAIIDKERAIYSILDEQKEFFINYSITGMTSVYVIMFFNKYIVSEKSKSS